MGHARQVTSSLAGPRFRSNTAFFDNGVGDAPRTGPAILWCRAAAPMRCL